MIINVALSRIQPNPWQTREGDPDPEYIKELALDIAHNGLLQAPVGRICLNRKNLDWRLYGGEIAALNDESEAVVQLAFGHNRLTAYWWLFDLRDNSDIQGDYSTIPVDIRSLTDEQMALMAWSENEKRKDVTPIERAKAIERRMADFGWNQHEVADQLGVARPTVANILRLLKLPQHMQDALQEGKISARVGSALLPMYELPEDLIKIANAGWMSKPKQIETDALAGNSSDKIRADVEQLYMHYTKKLQGAEFGLDELFTEGLQVGGYDFDGDQCKVYCGLCRTCDKRLKDSGNVCMDPSCYTAKTTLHRRKYLAAASGACGIPAVDPNKGGQPTFFPSYRSEESTTKIIESKCENLRLLYSQDATEGPERVKGHPHALIVCDKRNGSCTCIKGLEIAATRSVPSKVVDQAVQAEKELDPDYEGEDVDVEYEGDDPEGDLVRMIDDEKVRAQTEQPKRLSPKELEELARQARKEKMRMGEYKEQAREKVRKLMLEALKENQVGALYLMANSYPYPSARDLDMKRIMTSLAEQCTNKIMPGEVNSQDELYGIINRKLEALQLENVYPYKTLIEQFEEAENEN